MSEEKKIGLYNCDNMETKELFGLIISKRCWYKQLGYKSNYAWNLKQRYSKGLLKEDTMSKILILLGWEKKVKWVKK